MLCVIFFSANQLANTILLCQLWICGSIACIIRIDHIHCYHSGNLFINFLLSGSMTIKKKEHGIAVSKTV